MQRYFANNFQNNLILDETSSKHITKVMRNVVNDHVYICIDKIYYEYKIVKIADVVEVSFVKKLEINNENDINTTLVIPILKKDNHKIAIQKAIELGANKIYLYQGDNSVIKWKDANKKIEKLHQFIVDSCRQSFRNQIVSIEFVKLNDLELSNYDYLFFGDETKNKVSLNTFDKNDKILFISGCEGGFSKNEYKYFEQNKILPLSLAKTILRAETAPITFQSFITTQNKS